MAYRNDISVNWNASPRIITIASPSTEITMQDLHDTLVIIEDDLPNLSYKRIVKSSGKEPLDDAGTKVGITLSLLNAQLSFEGRSGPEWVLCSAKGGNLVAFDTDGISTIPQVYNTPFVNVSLTSSASATLQEQDALQYSSYGGVISVDILSANVGTAYPVGNMEYPVNNIPDSVSIAQTKGFDTLSLKSDLTLGAGDDVSDLLVSGIDPSMTVVNIETEAVCEYTRFQDVHVIGVFDGDSSIEHCNVGNIDFFSGTIAHSSINGEIILNGVNDARIHECSMGNWDIIPTVNMNGGEQDLIMTQYTGLINITNATDPDNRTGIGLSAGQVIIDASCTEGTFIISGDGTYVNNGGPNITIDVSGLNNPQAIAEATMSYTRP